MPQQPDFTQLIRLAQSSAGQKLLALLQASGGAALESVIAKAAAGNYEEAKNQLSSLLASPEAKALLQELEAQQ